MLPNSNDLSRPMVEDANGNNTATGNDSANDEALRLERSREYRRRYKERQKDKDKQLQNQMKETELEMERLRLEQESLKSQATGLHASCHYSSSMLDALTAAASASAAKVRSLGGRALEGVNTFRGWANHQWIMLPTAAELMSGTAWTASDDQIRFFLRVMPPEYFFDKHWKFVDRVETLLEEGKKYPQSAHQMELKVNYLISFWVRIMLIAIRETPDVLEEFVCARRLKVLREQAAAGSYMQPRMLQYGSTELAGFVALSFEQRLKLKEHWKQFVSDIEKARASLGKNTSDVADAVEAVMEMGEYKPTSSADAAKCFLLTIDAANASDEFLAKESWAFIKLYVGAVQLLTPMQIARILTSCRPLVAHIPDVCNMLLHGHNNTITKSSDFEWSRVPITNIDDC